MGGYKFAKGETFFEEDPYACALTNECVNTYCANCFTEDVKLYCHRCQWMNYCSAKCMNEDKVYHSVECDILRKTAEEDFPGSHTRMIIRALTREKYEKDNNCVSVGEFFGYKRTVDSFMTHIEDLDSDGYKQSLAATEEIYKLVKDKMDISLRDVFVMFQKSQINAHSVATKTAVVGVAMYLAASINNHSCEYGMAGYLTFFKGKKIMMRAMKNFKLKDGLDIHFSYIWPALPYSERQQHLKETYFFDCRCDRCVREEGKSEDGPYKVSDICEDLTAQGSEKKIIKRGLEYLTEFMKLGVPESYPCVWVVYFYLQEAALKCGKYEDSIGYGIKALSYLNTPCDLQTSLTHLSEALIRLGCNKKSHKNHKLFKNVLKFAKKYYDVLYGDEWTIREELLRRLNAVE